DGLKYCLGFNANKGRQYHCLIIPFQVMWHGLGICSGIVGFPVNSIAVLIVVAVTGKVV
ncbi:hypothetical protein ACJX0J_022481, partial [Zea mays]